MKRFKVTFRNGAVVYVEAYNDAGARTAAIRKLRAQGHGSNAPEGGVSKVERKEG